MRDLLVDTHASGSAGLVGSKGLKRRRPEQYLRRNGARRGTLRLQPPQSNWQTGHIRKAHVRGLQLLRSLYVRDVLYNLNAFIVNLAPNPGSPTSPKDPKSIAGMKSPPAPVRITILFARS
jgi:hypothetical protein